MPVLEYSSPQNDSTANLDRYAKHAELPLLAKQILTFGSGLLVGWLAALVIAILSKILLKNDRGDVVGDMPVVAVVSLLLTCLCLATIGYRLRSAKHRWSFYAGLVCSFVVSMIVWQMVVEYKPPARAPGP